MRIDFRYGALVYTDDVDIYNVSFIIVDKEKKKIECNNDYGFVIAMIHYKEMKECSFIPDGENGRMSGDFIDIVKNGEFIYKTKKE